MKYLNAAASAANPSMHGFIWIYMDSDVFCVDLYEFVWIYAYFVWIHLDLYMCFSWIYLDLCSFSMNLFVFCFDLYDFRRFIWIYVDLYSFSCIYMCFSYVYELGVAYKRAAGDFFHLKRRCRMFGLCQVWELSELSEFRYLWIWGPV